MFYKFRVEIPKVKGKIIEKEKNGSVYINYEYDRIYVPEKRYSIPKRTTIGKKCEDSSGMMYPNPNYLKYFPDADMPEEYMERTDRSSCIRIGAYIVIRKIVQDYGLDKMLLLSMDDEKSMRLAVDLAAYSIITENNAAQYYPDYAYNHALFTERHRIYSDAAVSEFLHHLTVDQSVEFLNRWNGSMSHKDKIYISYDSTNKNCQAGDVSFAEYGHAKEDDSKPIINISVAYDRSNSVPLFYEEYPGSINDASQFRCMIDKARGYGYRKCAFILDRGYFIPANIRYMDENGYDFIIMVKGMKELVSGLVMEHRNTFETDRRCSIAEYGAYGKTVETKVFASDEKERYVHVYYSPTKSASERSSLEKSIERTRKVLKRCEGKVKELDKSYERYFELQYEKKGKKDQRFVCAIERRGEIERMLKLCGYFCIITSQEMDAKDALRIYKSRDESEKLFMADKTFLGGSSMRVHSEESAEAKIFIEFIALIIRNRIYRLLKDEMIRSEMQANYMTVPAAIRELDKMEMIRQVGDVYKRDHALTKTQKTILRAFGMDSNDVTRQEKMIAEELNPKVVIEKISGGI